MPEINLLNSNKSQHSNLGQNLLGIGVKFLVVILVLSIAYYVWLFISGGQATSKVDDLQASISKAQSELLNQKDRQELIVRQGQLDALKTIMTNHVYWSNLFPKLSQATLKTASYVSFAASEDGTGVMEVSVPSYTDLDKFLQVFDFPQFTQNFSDLRITSISKIQEGDVLETKAQIKFKYNGTIIRKNSTNSAGGGEINNQNKNSP